MENVNEKQSSNFFLLLKQGFKGIFRFRIQFIIILILSFLATLVLTISVSTSRRLENAYEKIVKKVDPFDLVGSTRISDTASSNPGGAEIGKFRSTATTDFINNTFVDIENLEEENGLQKIVHESNFNFIFNNAAYENKLLNSQTFLTKVMDVVGEKSFYQLTVDYYQSLTKLVQNSEDEELALINLLRTQYQYSWNLKEQFANQLIKDLITYRDNPADLTVGYLTNTSLDFLLKINPHFLDFIGDSFNKLDFYNFNAAEKRFIRYLYWIGAQAAAWITDQDSIFGHVKEEKNKPRQPSIFDEIDSDNPAVTTPEDQAEVFHEFLLGRTYNEAEAKRPNFIINDEHKPYALTARMFDPWENDSREAEYLIVKKENQSDVFTATNDQKEALRKKGFKGITSPLSITIGDIKYIPGLPPIEDPKPGIRAVKFTENTEEFSLLNYDSNSSLSWNLNLELDFSYDYDINEFEAEEVVGGKTTFIYGWNVFSSNVKASMMQYHIEFNALSAGLDVRFRKESIVFDNITSRKFRFVILNTRDDANFTILRGTAPTAINEVAISQQFAQANKIKVGQYLAVGGTMVMVTGFAADAFTFFPNVDPDVPIPQPKTEAVIFGSKNTLKKIHRGNGNSSDGQNADPQMFSFFLTNNQKIDQYDLTTKKDLFTSLQMDLAVQLWNNFEYLKNFNQQNLFIPKLENESSLESFFGLKNFNDSNYRLSWTLMPLVMTTFQAITYVASAIIAIIAIIALVICIRKTINFNAKQIGILKAMGTNPWMIAVTYLAHSLVIIGVVVPAAWIIGTGLQVPFTMLFTQYFSAPNNIVLVDWISIVIALFGFGVLAVLTSMIAAYLITRKPVVQIINVSVKWSNSKIIDKMNNTIFKNASFHSRFSLTLLSSGKKPVALLVVVVGLTSLLISGAIAVPAVANNVIISYYKSIKYSNSYDNMPPTVNSPLSKTAINFWQGNEKWDKNWHEQSEAQLKLDNTNAYYGYYADPDGYMDSVSQASPIPKYIFKEDVEPSKADALVQNFTYAYAYLLQDPGRFLPLATSAFGNNFFTVLGQSFNIGTIDQFFGLILNSDYETIRELMGGKYNDALTLDANKQQLALEFSGSLTLALPNILSIIFQATSGGDSIHGDGVDWKQDVINVIMTQVPPYIRSYIEKSGSRTEQFSISFNSEPYVPKKESFVTKFSAQTDQYSNVPITGIDDNQTAFTMSKDARNRLFLDDQSLVKIEKIVNGDGQNIDSFSSQGIQVWNQDTKTLTLPMLDNHQSETGYKLKKNGLLKNISTTTRQLKFRTQDGWAVLPKNAWAYDDSDFWNSNLFNDPKKTLKLNAYPGLNLDPVQYQNAVKRGSGITSENNTLNDASSWLDIYALDNSRFSYNVMFGKTSTPKLKLNDESYFFNDFALNQKNEISASFARPYYNYRNIKLFLPIDLINEDDILRSSEKSSQVPEGNEDKWSWYYHVNAQDRLKLENKEVINQEYMVPDSVLNAWGLKRQDNPRFLVINPYDLKYAGDYGESGSLDRLITGEKYPYWGRYAFDSDYGPGALTYNNEEPVVYGRYKPDRTDFKINFQVVGTIDSYDSRLLLTDATLANMLLGYSTARTIGVSNSYLENNKGPDTIHNEKDKPRPWKPQLDVFDFQKPQLDVLIQGDRNRRLSNATYMKNLRDANNYQPLKWHTGKLSNIDEPVNLTSAVSFNVRDNLGFYSLGLMYPLGLGVNILVENQTLLSTQKALINQIYSLAISLGALLIIAIVITASLLIMLVGDVYIAQYLRFMILMRALGYSNRAVQVYAFGAATILSLIMWIITTILAWVLIFGFIKLMATWGFAIPYALSWWPPLVSFAIIFISFFGSLLVSSGKVRRGEVSSLVNESNE